MKAAIYPKYGSPNIIEIKEVTKPVPQDNELLIKVFATTVNRTDCANLTGKPYIMHLSNGLFKPKKLLWGTDFAGKVVEMGKDVSSFHVGDEVFGFNDSGLSSHAQYLTISADEAITKIPGNISYKQAAASIEGAHYSINFLNKIKLNKRDRILVNGASGAIGSATIQLLKAYGVKITAVCNPTSIQQIKEIGAIRAFDYNWYDFNKDRQQYDYVLDTVGKSSLWKCRKVLKSGGTYISSELGWMIQNVFFAILTRIFRSVPFLSGRKVKFPLPIDRKASVDLIRQLMEERKFKALIDRTYPFEEISEAYRYVLKGQKTGNVVISIMHDK